jgi:hypothetical protein
LCAPVHCAAGSDREMNFGVTGEAAPNAASSRVARYSCAARVAVSLISSGFHFGLGTDPCLLASAAIKLASTANPSALTGPLRCNVAPRSRKGDAAHHSRESARVRSSRTSSGRAHCRRVRAGKDGVGGRSSQDGYPGTLYGSPRRENGVLRRP